MEFDTYSESYNTELMKGVSLSGESADYFAQQRVRYVRDFMRTAKKPVDSIIEFGCGIGNNIEFLERYFPESRITGLDISDESLDVARQRFEGRPRIRFENADSSSSDGKGADLVFVNGVFHHIAPDDRPRHLRRLYDSLKKGAAMFIFENNPFNPGARWVMKRIPFDRDAVMVNPYRFAGQVRSLGCRTTLLRFFFIFPRFLSSLRFMEHYLINLPLGAQYCVAGFKDND